MREEIGKILRASGTTAVFVTHDQEEAFALADRVGVLNAGRLEQVAPPYELYHRPGTRFVAEFVGAADFLGRWSRRTESSRSWEPWRGPPDLAPGQAVDIMIRPDDIDFIPHPEGTSWW